MIENEQDSQEKEKEKGQEPEQKQEQKQEQEQQTQDKAKQQESEKQEVAPKSAREKSVREAAAEIADIEVSSKLFVFLGCFGFIVLSILAIIFIPKLFKENENEIPVVEKTKKTPKRKGAKIVKKPAKPRVKVITNKGDFIIELFEDRTPNTVANFIELCQKGFYDGIRFHRIIKDFMIQVGCPFARGKISRNAGNGDAGYKFADEIDPVKNKFDKKYLVAMANSGPNTNGSQFFITVSKPRYLDRKHTIFGAVISGKDVIDKIADVPTTKVPTASLPKDAPVEDVYIIRTQVLQMRAHKYHVKKLK